MMTYQTGQPWIVYTFGQTHDNWWPLKGSTRITGVAKVRAQCAVCGAAEVISMRIPRFGPVPEPEGGEHPERRRFCLEHKHPERGHAASWAKPLLNPAVGVDLDLLAMRLEADLNAEPTEDGA